MAETTLSFNTTIDDQNYTLPNLTEATTEDEIDVTTQKILTAVSYACTGLSVLCLTIHIAVYLLLPPIRNAPARMVIFMSIGWILAEALEIIDENIKTTHISCYIIGVIQQYIYISIFAWTNVMAYDLQRAFRSQVQSKVSRCRFATYCLYAWCLPSVIAIASVTAYVEIALSVNMVTEVCYYGSPLFTLITCAFIFSMLIANAVMFTLAMCALCKTARETRIAVKSKNGEYFALSVKLAVILGLPWFFLLFFSLTASPVASGVAEIFVGLHGVYVFFIFTFKRKIWRLLKRRFGWKKREENTTESIALKQFST